MLTRRYATKARTVIRVFSTRIFWKRAYIFSLLFLLSPFFSLFYHSQPSLDHKIRDSVSFHEEHSSFIGYLFKNSDSSWVKTVELKFLEITLNQLTVKGHKTQIVTQGSSGGYFLFKSHLQFCLQMGNVFLPYKPYNWAACAYTRKRYDYKTHRKRNSQNHCLAGRDFRKRTIVVCVLEAKTSKVTNAVYTKATKIDLKGCFSKKITQQHPEKSIERNVFY